MVLLAADYLDKTDGRIKLVLNLPAESKLVDLMSGQAVGMDLHKGEQTVEISLQGGRARLLEVRPK